MKTVVKIVFLGSYDPANDGDDNDADGLCDSEGGYGSGVPDDDDDNDGVEDSSDTDSLDALVCKDEDGDGCDDCSGNRGTLQVQQRLPVLIQRMMALIMIVMVTVMLGTPMMTMMESVMQTIR